MTKKSAGRKAIESYTKHEDLVDNAVKLGQQAGLNVSATEGNDPNGDVRVSVSDKAAFIKLLSETIDANKEKRKNPRDE